MSLDPRRWLSIPPLVQRHEGISVVRDDLLEGGSKLRFLPFLCQGASEVVFGGPFCGGAPLALSVMGRESGQRVTIFYAKRNVLSPRQQRVLANGANIEQVPYGYMSNVQAKARAYAERWGALFLPLGFDVPAAREPFLEALSRVRRRIGSPDEVWCATGSGMLARCLGEAFPESHVKAVAVGLASRHSKQVFTPNVELIEHKLAFAQRTRESSPFPSCGHYDRKAWELCRMTKHGDRRKSVLFWNVMTDHV